MCHRNHRFLGLCVTACLALAVTGCAHDRDKQSKRKEKKKEEVAGAKYIPADNEVRQIDRFSEMQAAKGARDDRMLFAQHFDGGEINSLGRSKLHLIMMGQPVG